MEMSGSVILCDHELKESYKDLLKLIKTRYIPILSKAEDELYLENVSFLWTFQGSIGNQT